MNLLPYLEARRLNAERQHKQEMESAELNMRISVLCQLTALSQPNVAALIFANVPSTRAD